MSTAEPKVVHEAIACLGRLSAVFLQRRRDLAALADLTEQQWAVLDEIGAEGFMPSLFARQRESSPAAVSKILRQLQDKGLVTVSVSEDDGRHRSYELTARGRDRLELIAAWRRKAIEQVWERFDSDTLAQFTRFGEELTERLNQYQDGGQRESHAVPTGK